MEQMYFSLFLLLMQLKTQNMFKTNVRRRMVHKEASQEPRSKGMALGTSPASFMPLYVPDVGDGKASQ